MAANTTVQRRMILIATLTAVGSAAVTTAAWHAHARASLAIRQSTYDRLTSIRESKRREITAYLEDTCAETERLARAPWIVEAMQRLNASFDTIRSTQNDRDLVTRYYEQEIQPRLNGGRSQISAVGLVPEDPAAIAAQAAFIARNPFPVGEKASLSNVDDGSAYSDEHAQHHGPLRDLIQTFGYYDLFLIAPDDGRIVYTVFKEIDYGTRLIGGPYEDSGLADAFRLALPGDGRATVVDFRRYAPSYLAPAAFIAAPIRMAGTTVGVLAIQLPVDRLDAVMTGAGSWREDGLGVSGETYLVGADGLMRSRSRFLIEDPDRFISKLREIDLDEDTIRRIAKFETTILLQPVRTTATKNALNGSAGTHLIDDYRGVSVLSSYAPLHVAGLEWAILSEIDTDEAFGPIRDLRNQIGLLTIGVIAAFVVAAWVIARALARSERLALEKERVDRDLSIARDIQQSLLPQSVPNISGYDITGWNCPADETGGDYFDWQHLPDNKLLVSLADVTGHGIGPALVTAVCRAYARASLAEDNNLVHVLGRINHFLHEDLPSGRFVTFVVGLLDGEQHEIELLSAGHGPLFIYSAATARVESLNAHALPLAVMDEVVFEAGNRIPLEPGDVVLLVTDGFFEWQDASGEQFGLDRLVRCFATHAKESASSIIAHLYRQVQEFTAGSVQSDDLTALVVKREARSTT